MSADLDDDDDSMPDALEIAGDGSNWQEEGFVRGM